jgi:hypothetical protein
MRRFLLTALFFVFVSNLYGDDFEEKLRQVPLRDKVHMKVLFREAIMNDQAGHVLCCDHKPACLISCVLKGNSKRFQDVLLLKGWNAFKRHEHQFAHPEFILNANIKDFTPDFKVLHLYVIKKESLARCLDQNIDIFKQTLGEEFTADSFISNLENGRPLLDLIKDDEMLIGILLGFGRESSRAFKETEEEYWHTERYGRITLNKPKGCKMHPVAFMGDPYSTEVESLVSTYEDELKTIWKEFQGNEPLDFFLRKICSK